MSLKHGEAEPMLPLKQAFLRPPSTGNRRHGGFEGLNGSLI
jgi:hypothetical protein